MSIHHTVRPRPVSWALAGLTVIGLATPAAASAAPPAAATAPGGPATPAAAASAAPAGATGEGVADAARAYGVPDAVLAAYAYAQTRWEDHDGQMSTDGGYGPGHLVDGSAVETGGRDGGGPGDDSGKAAKERVDTLGRAARLTGASRAELVHDVAANLRGAAAVLADTQRSLHHPVGRGTDPASWYAAIVGTAPTTDRGIEVADAAMAALRTGAARTTSDGRRYTLARTTVGAQAVRQRADLHRRHRQPDPTGPDCPRSLACEWLPAPYQQLSADPTDYGNHDLANRPKGPRIDTIVIHDTEGYYPNDIAMVQDPTYLAWSYTIRSADGHVAQHLPAKDIGWHAGNWYVNMHSVGIEHEGFAAKGGTWFTESMYRSSAALVRHLAREYRIPLDRAHVIGHDQVPGSTAATVAGMHWDPGPYWDWAHYFDLLGAPLDAGTRGHARPRAGQVVRVLPRFASNVQPLTGCTGPGAACDPQGSNVVPVRQAPAEDAPLVNDAGLRPTGAASTWDVADWGGKASAGTDYVVAQVRGEWVGIWFAGQLGWVHDPGSAPTLRVLRDATVVRAVQAGAPTYGRAYPETSAYPAGVTPQAVAALPYTIAPGQAYVVTDARPQTDYYAAKTFDVATPGDHVDVVGRDRYVQIDLGHRLGYVRVADVRLGRAR